MVFKKGNKDYKLRRTYKGEQNPFYSKHHTEDSKKKIGAKKGSIPWNKDKTNIYSKESLQKMRELKQNYIPWNKDKTVITDSRIKKYIRYGQSSNLYIHGNAYEPYDTNFNQTLKNIIFDRDNGICQLCHKPISIRCATHHIDYNKKNSNLNNLVLLCNSCHSRTNYNRDKWIKLLQPILLKK